MSMSEKLGVDEKMADRGQYKSKLVGVSMLILSVLLTVSVASLIYMAVSNSSTYCQGSQPQPASQNREVEVKATVNVKSSDGKRDVQEKVSYSRSQHVAYYYGSDGSFNMDDFGKGLHINKAEDGTCYVIPVGFNKTAEKDIENFLQDFKGEDADLETDDANAEIFDGKIVDTSFLPEKARSECPDGFQWMAIVPKGNQSEDTGKELSREKRAICTRYRYICSWRIIFGRLRYRCLIYRYLYFCIGR